MNTRTRGISGPNVRIALLSTIESPILGFILEKLLSYGIAVDSIIFDSKADKKLPEIWQERTSGRLSPRALCEFENEHIACFFVKDHNSSECSRLVKENKIDLLVNAGTPRILKKNILSAPRIGVINGHQGLLPDFRGCTNTEWAIYLDEKSGNTAHFMTKKIDEGPIVLKEALTFDRADNYQDIRIKIYRHGFDLLARGVKRVLKERLNPRNIDYVKGGRYFKVMDKAKLREVIEKAGNGEYKYQLPEKQYRQEKSK